MMFGASASNYCSMGQQDATSLDSSPSSTQSSGCTRSRKNKEDKICGVCGDKALGFNFDAISCESCKAFFRRNAPKGLGYFKCPYDEKCKMDLSNRRFCKRCRLKKCFEIGMRKEYILTEEEKALKRQKIEENRYLKKMCTLPGKTPSPQSDTSGYEKDSIDMSPGVTNSITTGQVPSAPLPTQQAVLSTAGASVPISPPQVYSPIVLSIEDEAAIYDLQVAYRNSLEVNTADQQDLSRDQANFSDLVNIAELSVRRVIAMAKQVPAFRALPQVEQIHLLKGGSIELLILRSVITFDAEKQHFLDPVDREETSAMKLEQLQRAETGTGLFDDHMHFVRTLAVDLRADETTLILLLVISLFSPDRDNLEHKELVAAEQERYSLLLRSYLESLYPPSVSRLLYPRLLMTLTDIRNLNEEHSQVLLKVNPEGIQPLMKEVLDLTN
jgi:nuclear receptor subfamily 1 group I